jgi:hypothetical protein
MIWIHWEEKSTVLRHPIGDKDLMACILRKERTNVMPWDILTRKSINGERFAILRKEIFFGVSLTWKRTSAWFETTWQEKGPVLDLNTWQKKDQWHALKYPMRRKNQWQVLIACGQT